MGGELIIGLGLCTPLGLSAQMSLASMRAGIVRFSETEVLDNAGEPVRASRLQLLEPSLSRTERMVALGCEALAGVESLLAQVQTKQVPLYLALPEASVGAAVEPELLLTELLAGGRLELAGTYEGGRAGFFEALVAAQADLRSGRAGPIAVVGAVDSLCDRQSLSRLVVENLHLGPQNPDGRIPGEAAGFVVVARRGVARMLGGEAVGVMLAVTLGEEPRPFAQRTPSLADGLTQVFRQLRVDLLAGARRVDSVLSCQPGESFWSTEFSRAYLRNATLMPEPLHLRIAGEFLGDAGAGAGPVMLGAALYRPRRQMPEAPRTLVYGSADGGQIGACMVEVVSMA